MKTVTIVLLIVSALLVLMGIFLLSTKNQYAVSDKGSKYSAVAVKINAIGNIIVGVLGGILALVYQFVEIQKNVLLFIFLAMIIIVNIIQGLLKKKYSK